MTTGEAFSSVYAYFFFFLAGQRDATTGRSALTKIAWLGSTRRQPGNISFAMLDAPDMSPYVAASANASNMG